MEARQRVKLSLTNRSIGLIPTATASRAAASPQEDKLPKTADASVRRITSSNILTTRQCRPTALRAVGRPGGHSEGPAPDPIPNSAVKTLRANGTASQDVGE